MIKQVKEGTTALEDTVVAYTDTKVATNRFVLLDGYVTVIFFDGEEREFEASFIEDEIVTDNLTIGQIVNNLTEVRFGGWDTIVAVRYIHIGQIYEVTRRYLNGPTTEYKTEEVALEDYNAEL